jgi:Holliday junction resolvase-like predicted endonuclease
MAGAACARETFAYWYLRQKGCVFVAQNFVPRGTKGEIDLFGYDGDVLAFVEARTWTAREDQAALPELSVAPDKPRLVVPTAQRFLSGRQVKECPLQFDVVAIEEVLGKTPEVRLHKKAFGPAM